MKASITDIVQAAIAIIIVLTICLIWLSNGTVDDSLVAVAGLVVGYFFRRGSEDRADQLVAQVAPYAAHVAQLIDDPR